MAYVHLCTIVRSATRPFLPTTHGWRTYVHVGDWAILGGFTVVHQFVRIQAHAMTAMCSLLFADVLTFVMCQGQPAAAAP